MTKNQLFQQIVKKGTFLCIGLDTDIDKIPPFLKNEPNPLFTFNEAIIEATHDICVAYKPNTAFYEVYGEKGWEILNKTQKLIPTSHFTIADAKRGDIGNTSEKYAQAFFQNMDFDAVTLSPYMGKDTISPFLKYENKWGIILALTSNQSAEDFEQLILNSDKKLYEVVLEKSKQWGTDENTMFVVGATQTNEIQNIRKIVPNHFLLVPGIGSQGGNLEEVAKLGLNDSCGLLVNASRSIIYASQDKDFAIKARKEAIKINEIMKKMLDNYL